MAEITVVVPSLNQGDFLADALDSILIQGLDAEIVVMDGGSNDDSLAILRRYESALTYWQSCPDGGQAAAINAGMAKGSAPLVCWLNSDDFYYPGALAGLQQALVRAPKAPFAYGHAWHVNEVGRKRVPYLSLPYHPYLMASYCGICQPATLIRRSCWAAVGGLDPSLELAFDYDVWLRLIDHFGPPATTRRFVAANRMHNQTKTSMSLDRHYDESIGVVRRHFGRVPIKWRLMRGLMRTIRHLARWWRGQSPVR